MDHLGVGEAEVVGEVGRILPHLSGVCVIPELAVSQYRESFGMLEDNSPFSLIAKKMDKKILCSYTSVF